MYHYKDENKFMEVLQERVRTSTKFIFATDCKATADKFHDKLLELDKMLYRNASQKGIDRVWLRIAVTHEIDGLVDPLAEIIL